MLVGYVRAIDLGFPLTIPRTIFHDMIAGGTFCFLLSSRFAGPVVKLDRVKPRVKGFQGKVQQAYAEGTLFFYLLFLRLFPATPNFFINMASYWVRKISYLS